MSISEDQREEERRKRANKIRKHLAKTEAAQKAVPSYADDEPLQWSAAAVAGTAPEEAPSQSQPATGKADHSTGKAELKADQSEPKADLKAGPQSQPAKAVQPLIYPPLQPWEKLDRWGRRYQARPMTRDEHEAEQEAAFLKKQFDADQAHAANIRRAEQEAKAEQQATKKRAEQEARTGKRPYEPTRYVSLEEARSRGYLGSGSSGSGHESTAQHDPRDNRGNLMRRFGA
jgi:hypothetical protein